MRPRGSTIPGGRTLWWSRSISFPFAGLAFLWFVGVIRDRIGAAEDRFFATVFLGTGLLFVAMLFVAGAVAGGMIATESQRGAAVISPEVWRLGRETSYLILNVFAMRMAGAFTIVTTTIALRLGILPRWLAVFGWVVAVVLLVTIERFAWVQILFPVWVLVLSIHLLVHPPAGRRPTPLLEDVHGPGDHQQADDE